MVPNSVAAALAREAGAGRLDFDPAQNEVAARLDRLSLELRERRRSRGALQRLGLSWISGAAPGPPPRGIYLWGGVGRGKTHLMDLFYETLGFPERERIHFYRFMQAVHARLRSLTRRAEPLESVAQGLAARARVLCLDEFFVADIGDAMILAGLFAGLFRRGVTLVATSNQPPQELYADGLQRQRFLPAIDLIGRHLDVMRLDGPTDYRLRRLESAHTYRDSALPGTEGELRGLFSSLAHGATSGPVEVLIADRRIAARDTSLGSAWFDFDQLCAGARAAGDYIELAHLYHTIFLSNVPVLGGADDDAARRFLTLIDELYDRGVKVVVSAQAPPAQLYRGERLQAEFRRAASRLVEMQSKQYLARQHRA